VKQLSFNLFDPNKNSQQKYPEIIILPSNELMPDGEIIVDQNFFGELESDQLFNELRASLHWRQDKIKMFGKEVNIPRLTAWYGDQGKSYTYSGITMNPDGWTQTLLLIKTRVEKIVGLKFNSVLVNLYRNGKDYVSWHSDDEKELGKNPTIASVSLGATRRFLLRHKSNQALDTIEITLSHGSLLIMKGTTQHFWKHQIPKSSRVLTERINLTFRTIV
jgi:alkylated DNA repair dioxygenase AlkB